MYTLINLVENLFLLLSTKKIELYLYYLNNNIKLSSYYHNMQNTEYIENYLFLQKLPFSEKLIKENNKLKKKNKELRSLVKLITKNIEVFEKPTIDTSEVYIKQEKDIEVIDKPSNTNNIKVEFKEIEKINNFDQNYFDIDLNKTYTESELNKFTPFIRGFYLKIEKILMN